MKLYMMDENLFDIILAVTKRTDIWTFYKVWFLQGQDILAILRMSLSCGFCILLIKFLLWQFHIYTWNIWSLLNYIHPPYLLSLSPLSNPSLPSLQAPFPCSLIFMLVIHWVRPEPSVYPRVLELSNGARWACQSVCICVPMGVGTIQWSQVGLPACMHLKIMCPFSLLLSNSSVGRSGGPMRLPHP